MKIGINDKTFEAIFRRYLNYIKKPMGICFSVPIDMADSFEIERTELNCKRQFTQEMFEIIDDEWEGKRDQITAITMGWTDR